MTDHPKIRADRFDAILADVQHYIVRAVPDEVRNAVILANGSDYDIIRGGLVARGADPALMYLRGVPVALALSEKASTSIMLGGRMFGL